MRSLCSLFQFSCFFLFLTEKHISTKIWSSSSSATWASTSCFLIWFLQTIASWPCWLHLVHFASGLHQQWRMTRSFAVLIRLIVVLSWVSWLTLLLSSTTWCSSISWCVIFLVIFLLRFASFMMLNLYCSFNNLIFSHQSSLLLCLRCIEQFCQRNFLLKDLWYSLGLWLWLHISHGILTRIFSTILMSVQV